MLLYRVKHHPHVHTHIYTHNITQQTKIIQQICTLLAVIVTIIIGHHLVIAAEHSGPNTISLLIETSNILLPHLVRILTSFESHRNKSLKTAFQY